ncbi:MAG: DUF5412 domain-containing protein [Eubacterium sp.]|nr:DUF5412 domain-containing protein [Eubacterium sp.]
MKKATTVLSCLLFLLIILLPTVVFGFACFGYTFELKNYFVFAILTAILSVCTVIFSLITKDAIKNKMVSVLMAVILLFSLINAAVYIFACSTFGVITSVFISVGCCCFLTVKHGKPVALRITVFVLSVLIALPIGFFSCTALIFGNASQNMVVKTVESPSGKYYAEVVDSDQGALGGNTLVDVYEKIGIDSIIFKIEKKPQSVYSGEWGEFENMEIYWRDEQYLVINSVEYEIK